VLALVVVVVVESEDFLVTNGRLVGVEVDRCSTGGQEPRRPLAIYALRREEEAVRADGEEGCCGADAQKRRSESVALGGRSAADIGERKGEATGDWEAGDEADNG
jgi:hypothetical protein